jgi:selenocysteine lyase/cysteine desulfurase
MESAENTKFEPADILESNKPEKHSHKKNEKTEPFAELERGIHAALETYSNVHRGKGHYSMVTTHLFEQAREIVLEYLHLSKNRYSVIFCSPRRAELLKSQLNRKSYQSISSHEIGLSLGVWAIAIKRNSLPKGVPFQTGGGTTKLISKDWVIWANGPDKFEAGTPAIINIIAFAKALRMIQQSGKNIFINSANEKLTASEILYHDELENYSGQELLDKLRQTVIGSGVCVPTTEGFQPFVNLDNSASTPTFTPVWNAFRHSLRQPQEVKQEIIQEVKSICADVLGAPLSDYEVIFTSNTTEAINLAAESFSREKEDDTEPVVVNTLLEHSSNDLPWRMIPGVSLIRLSVNGEGFVDLNELETLLNDYNQKCLFGKKRIKFVAVSGASNVLGVCNNLEEIGRIVHRYGARLLVDAAQLVAHRKVNMEGCGMDYLTFSAHKVYAPFGCGVLVVKKGLLAFNSTEMELINSSGEENVGGIAALGKSLLLLKRIGMELIQREEQALTGLALWELAKIDGLEMFGIKDPESLQFPQKLGVIVFRMKSMMPYIVAKELAVRGGIGVRTGCHCAHIIIKHILGVSPSLERFQRVMQTYIPSLKFPGLIRVSLGIENTKEDVDQLIFVLHEIANKNKKPADGHSAKTLYKSAKLSKEVVKQQMDEFVRTVAGKVYNQAI